MTPKTLGQKNSNGAQSTGDSIVLTRQGGLYDIGMNLVLIFPITKISGKHVPTTLPGTHNM